jgi:hypothetical protein
VLKKGGKTQTNITFSLIMWNLGKKKDGNVEGRLFGKRKETSKIEEGVKREGNGGWI